MKTLVVFDSEFGNTQRIAEAVGAALSSAQVQHIGQVTPADLSSMDLLVVGSPTQRLNFTESMRAFLDSIPHGALQGVNTAAFDTRISIEDAKSTAARVAMRVFLHRYAAKPIAKALKDKGGIEVIDPEGFFVLDTEGPLMEGELDRAAAWAQELASRCKEQTT